MTLSSAVVIDSFDSSAGTYASQAVNKFKSHFYAGSDAKVTSNGDIGLRSNSTIWGDANPGPSGNRSLGVSLETYRVSHRPTNVRPEPCKKSRQYSEQRRQ